MFIKKQLGFSMLEVLVTVFVTSFGLLGMAGLQISSIKSSTIATVNTQAMISINEIVGLIRASPGVAKLGKFNIDPDADNNVVAFSTSLEPSGGSVLPAETNTYNWFRNLNNAMPGVKAGIYCSTLGRCAIKVELPLKVNLNSNTNMTQLVSIQI